MPRCVAVALAVLVASGVVTAADLKSGPQVGATLPGPFEPLNLNGPDAGDESCLYCRYGNVPVVMVFASKPSEKLAKLVGEVEKAAAAAKAEVGACLVVTDTSAATQTVLKKLADDAKLKATILSVIDPGKLKDYELAKDAEVTVLLYSRRVVRINHAFKSGELTDKAIEAVAADAAKHLAGQ
jgi:hypothetical protein